MPNKTFINKLNLLFTYMGMKINEGFKKDISELN